MTPPYTPEYVLPILERAIAERNNSKGVGGATKVAEELGTSPSMVTQIRNGNYPEGSLQKWYAEIVAKFGHETVNCPELRCEINLASCTEHKRRQPTADSFYARMYRACQACDQNRSE